VLRECPLAPPPACAICCDPQCPQNYRPKQRRADAVSNRAKSNLERCPLPSTRAESSEQHPHHPATSHRPHTHPQTRISVASRRASVSSYTPHRTHACLLEQHIDNSVSKPQQPFSRRESVHYVCRLWSAPRGGSSAVAPSMQFCGQAAASELLAKVPTATACVPYSSTTAI